MIDPDFELDRFRQRMIQDNLASQHEIEDIVFETLMAVNEAILMSISEAVAEVTDYAINIGCEEFLAELEVVENGPSWVIASTSGKTDFSIPARPMLPHLLKNAKVAKDGSQYKVIPVGKSDGKAARRMTSLHEVLQRRQADINEARAALHRKTMDSRSARANDMASAFSDIIKSTLQDRAEFYKGAIASQREAKAKPAPSGGQEYRTATSKQDESTQWVIPAREMDMTGMLNDVNAKIAVQHDQAILTIIESYEHKYADVYMGRY